MSATAMITTTNAKAPFAAHNYRSVGHRLTIAICWRGSLMSEAAARVAARAAVPAVAAIIVRALA